jgi:hypothetical protein
VRLLSLNKRFFSATSIILALSPLLAVSAGAQSDGSMNDLWDEQKGPKAGATSAAPAPGAPKAAGARAPLCTLTDLKGSEFITSGGWPGVGPFVPDAGKTNEMVDESKNRLKVNLSGDDVTQAELYLVNQTKNNNRLALQMTTNFFLEALGAKSGRIADFNHSLEEKKAILETKPEIDLKTGNYAVKIQRKRFAETPAGSDAYVIAVRSEAPITLTRPTASSPIKPASVLSTPIVYKPEATSPAMSTPPVTVHQAQPPAKPPQNEALKRQFTTLMQQWQELKRQTVKSRQSQNLTTILGGKALQVQTQAINKLNEKGLFYEMTPLSLDVLGYDDITPGRTYLVHVNFKEKQKLIVANTMAVLKETEKNYSVDYTVENIRGQWLIIDSKVTSSN